MEKRRHGTHTTIISWHCNGAEHISLGFACQFESGVAAFGADEHLSSDKWICKSSVNNINNHNRKQVHAHKPIGNIFTQPGKRRTAAAAGIKKIGGKNDWISSVSVGRQTDIVVNKFPSVALLSNCRKCDTYLTYFTSMNLGIHKVSTCVFTRNILC